MVAKTSILTARQYLEETLQSLVRDDDSARIWVYETEAGMLRAIVGSDLWRGQSLAQRHDRIWRSLRQQVDSDSLRFVSGVHALDQTEYDSLIAEE